MLTSLHHVTATVANAQADVDFYTGLLGLRLVKKTVNFDNPFVYHFYYGTSVGAPGTLMTTFPYEGTGVRKGTKGTGQITRSAFAVPAGAMEFWRERLLRAGLIVKEGVRFGENVIVFDDPSGLELELVGTASDSRTPWTGGGIGADLAIRGLHSVTLEIRDPRPTEDVLYMLGFKRTNVEADRRRYVLQPGASGQIVDVLHELEAPAGQNGIGTVHHVAFAVPTETEQLSIREEVIRFGLNVTEVRARNYFRSIYFREPGGVLFEVATEVPGFLIDEDEASLGQALKLPEWEEPRRAEIEAVLPEVRY